MMLYAFSLQIPTVGIYERIIKILSDALLYIMIHYMMLGEKTYVTIQKAQPRIWSISLSIKRLLARYVSETFHRFGNFWLLWHFRFIIAPYSFGCSPDITVQKAHASILRCHNMQISQPWLHGLTDLQIFYYSLYWLLLKLARTSQLLNIK